MRLPGKTFAVTGAGSGIGRETALEFARRGADVALCDLRPDWVEETAHLVEAIGRRATTRQVDVAESPQVDEWVTAALADHGTIDGLVNNAGISLPGRPVDQVSEQDLRRVLDVNLWGTVYPSLAFLPHLRSRPEASLVSVASVGALVGFPGQVGYCTSKFAVRGFTEALRMDLHRTNVRVMVVLPGVVRGTNILRHAQGATASEAESTDRRLQRTPMTPDAAWVARKLVDGVERRRTRLLVGKDVTALDFLTRWAPVSSLRLLAPIATRMAGVTVPD